MAGTIESRVYEYPLSCFMIKAGTCLSSSHTHIHLPRHNPVRGHADTRTITPALFPTTRLGRGRALLRVGMRMRVSMSAEKEDDRWGLATIAVGVGAAAFAGHAPLVSLHSTMSNGPRHSHYLAICDTH